MLPAPILVVTAGGNVALRNLVLDDAVRHGPQLPPPKLDPLPFDTVELLQLAELSRRSMVLDVTVDEQFYGRVVVVDGAPWWARDVLGDGEEPFLRLTFRRCADTTCALLDDPPPARNLHGTLAQLLLDAARMHDEERRDRDDLVSIDDADVFALAD